MLTKLINQIQELKKLNLEIEELQKRVMKLFGDCWWNLIYTEHCNGKLVVEIIDLQKSFELGFENFKNDKIILPILKEKPFEYKICKEKIIDYLVLKLNQLKTKFEMKENENYANKN